MSDTAHTDGPRLRTATGDGIRWIIADNQARLNAYTREMWAALPERLAEAQADPDVRVVVLRGAGTRAFSAGADISEFASARTPETAVRYDRLSSAAFEATAQCAKPTIAMIHGVCMGGGLELALCCDFRLADDTARLAIPSARLGIGYDPRWIKPLLAVVSPAHAKEILFTGRRFTAEAALAMGLVNRVLAPDDLEAAVRELAGELAANAPLAILAAKRCIDAFAGQLAPPDLAPLDALIEACLHSADYAEGQRAFLEKRKPRFSGR